MGLNISSILPRNEITLEQLKNKKVAVDTYIYLYEFLRTLPKLTDRKGRLTTHLIGLFYRTTRFMSYKIKPCFVFDGFFPDINKEYPKIINKPVPARISSTITGHVIESSKKLLELLGLPVIQAPSEGEAQAAYLAKKGDTWAAATKDFDCLLFKTPRMIQNLTLAKKRKLPKKGFVWIGSYFYELESVLKTLDISHEQLITLAILIGTDFNQGIKGIGPKKALKLVKEYKTPEKLFGKIHCPGWEKVYHLIRNIPITTKYKIRYTKPDYEGIKAFLVKEHDFNETRVESALERIS
jgi:flap endonuclease-1